MAGNGIKIIGYGNLSRLDDGLGPAMIDELEAENLENVDLETDFQLNIEDVVGLDQYEAVIFVDADVSCKPPFSFYEVEPVVEISFTSHTVSPAALLGLAESHFGIRIPGYIMAIRGYEFDDFGETLSEGARENLSRAKEFLLDFLAGNTLKEAGNHTIGELNKRGPDHDCEEYYEGR